MLPCKVPAPPPTHFTEFLLCHLLFLPAAQEAVVNSAVSLEGRAPSLVAVETGHLEHSKGTSLLAYSRGTYWDPQLYHPCTPYSASILESSC